MFGDAIVDHEKIAINNAFDPDQFIHMGVLPSGADFNVNKLAAECDLLVTEGFIEPHFFAGFSGGRKSILPGICSQETVNENHSYKAISSPYANTGVLEHNPIHEDMLAAAKMVNVQFIFNVALDGQKKIIAAWAGDLEKAHAEGVAFIRKWSQCPSITGDIVVTSNGGYPLDQNLYQSPKAVATAEACAGEDGVIIMCCSCADGMGGTHFENHDGHRGRDRRLPFQDPAQGDHSRTVVPADLCPHPEKAPRHPRHHLPQARGSAQGQHDPRFHPG